MEKTENFFDRVKELVKENGQTLKEFLADNQINYEMYNGLKRYNNLPRADEAVKIAKALNTSVEYLVTGDKPELTSAQARSSLARLLQVVDYIDANNLTINNLCKNIPTEEKSH